jgi:cytosine permease
MYVAQVKAQVLNTYSGSLSLTNLADGLLGRSPGRVVMVVVGNVIALLMVSADILGLIGSYLGILGVTTTALAGVIIADFFIVRRRQVASPTETEAVNWAGVISVIGAALLGGVLLQTGVTSLGFLVALATVLVAYPALRTTVLKPTADRVPVS